MSCARGAARAGQGRQVGPVATQEAQGGERAVQQSENGERPGSPCAPHKGLAWLAVQGGARRLLLLTVVQKRSSMAWRLALSHSNSSMARRHVPLSLPSCPTSLSSFQLSRDEAGSKPGAGSETGAEASCRASSCRGRPARKERARRAVEGGRSASGLCLASDPRGGQLSQRCKASNFPLGWWGAPTHLLRAGQRCAARWCGRCPAAVAVAVLGRAAAWRPRAAGSATVGQRPAGRTGQRPVAKKGEGHACRR